MLDQIKNLAEYIQLWNWVWWLGGSGDGVNPAVVISGIIAILMVRRADQHAANLIKTSDSAKITEPADQAVMRLTIQTQGPNPGTVERDLDLERASVERRLSHILAQMQIDNPQPDTPPPRAPYPWELGSYLVRYIFGLLSEQIGDSEEGTYLTWKSTEPETTADPYPQPQFGAGQQMHHRAYVNYTIKFFDTAYVRKFALRLDNAPAVNIDAIEWSFSRQKKLDLKRQASSLAIRDAHTDAVAHARALGKSTASNPVSVKTVRANTDMAILARAVEHQHLPQTSHVGPTKRLPGSMFQIPSLDFTVEVAIQCLAE